jgi:hypothetical protein
MTIGTDGTPDTPSDTAVSDDRVPSDTAAAWKQGEERLYRAALGDVRLYRRTMELVGMTLEHLRSLGSGTTKLLEAAAEDAKLVAEAAHVRAVDAAGLDLRLVANAALALRHREVIAEQAARRRRNALDDARSRGETRVVLEEYGDVAGDPFRPYVRLEAEVATGRALLVSASPDEEFRRCVHTVETRQVDLGTGAVRGLDDYCVAPTFAEDEHARERFAARAWEVLTGSCAPPKRSP